MLITPLAGRHKKPSQIRLEDGLLYITLRTDFEAIVDEADLEIISGFKWSLMTTMTGHAYAYRLEHNKTILMHRELLAAPAGLQVDHEDGDGLNNRRKNIALATPAQNSANRAADRRNKLGVKGVTARRPGRFRAAVTAGNKKIYLGTFETAAEASAAYLGAARVLWGKFARSK